MLKLRDKLSQKRNVLMHDEEKPFLEHLDDLRKMLMRIVTTLLISVTLCFVFNKWFFDVVQYPMKRAGLAAAQEKHLPANIDMPAWERIHGAARGAMLLQEPVRTQFLNMAVSDASERAYAEGYLLYCAASVLPETQRQTFLESAVKSLPAERNAPVLAAGKAILEAGPSVSLEKLKPVIQNVAMAPAEPFMLSMKLSTFAGIIVAFPLLFYYLLEFILPGLNPREKKLLWPALSIGFGLFLMGVSFAFWMVVPNALEFFYEYGAELNILSTWRIGDYISFVVSFCLIFGASFELPVVVMILVKLELLTSATMRRTRAWAIIIIVTAGAILTPTGDIYTLSLLSGPMIVMYEICIWMAVALEKKNARLEAEEAARDMARRAALVGVASTSAARPSPMEAAMQSGAGESSGNPYDPVPGDPGDGSGPHDDYHDYHGDPHKDPHGHDYPYDHDHGHGHEHPDGFTSHPHGHDESKPTPDEEYAQYMREHAHLFPPAETHAESIPVEERNAPEPTADPMLGVGHSEAETAAKAEVESDVKAEAEAEVPAGAKAEASSEAKAEAKAESKAEAKDEPEAKAADVPEKPAADPAIPADSAKIETDSPASDAPESRGQEGANPPDGTLPR